MDGTYWPEIKVECQYIGGDGKRHYQWYIECEGKIDDTQWDMIEAISECVEKFNKKEEEKCINEDR